jgi:hypothetical protein
MSFMPRLSPEEVEELFQLYVRANVKAGVTPVEAKNLTIRLRDRLREIWDAGSKPFPFTFEDFRRGRYRSTLGAPQKRNAAQRFVSR